MLKEPMAFQPIGVGMKKDEPPWLAKINATVGRDVTRPASLDQYLGKVVVPTRIQMVREDKVVPVSELKFTPLPWRRFAPFSNA